MDRSEAGIPGECPGCKTPAACRVHEECLAPPPPAEQASGEHVETLREIRLAYGDAPNHFTAEKAALDHAIAALSQRPVGVLDQIRQRPGYAKACAEVQSSMAYDAGWRVAAQWADRDDLVADIGSPAYERDKAKALAPQQPEKGEG